MHWQCDKRIWSISLIRRLTCNEKTRRMLKGYFHGMSIGFVNLMCVCVCHYQGEMNTTRHIHTYMSADMQSNIRRPLENTCPVYWRTKIMLLHIWQYINIYFLHSTEGNSKIFQNDFILSVTHKVHIILCEKIEFFSIIILKIQQIMEVEAKVVDTCTVVLNLYIPK